MTADVKKARRRTDWRRLARVRQRECADLAAEVKRLRDSLELVRRALEPLGRRTILEFDAEFSRKDRSRKGPDQLMRQVTAEQYLSVAAALWSQLRYPGPAAGVEWWNMRALELFGVRLWQEPSR